MADPIIKKNSAKFDTAHNIETHADIANKTAEVYNLVTGEKYAASDAITVESKSITENGTYTAPAGKAYSPITVNVESGGAGEEVTVNIVNNHTDTIYPIIYSGIETNGVVDGLRISDGKYYYDEYAISEIAGGTSQERKYLKLSEYFYVQLPSANVTVTNNAEVVWLADFEIHAAKISGDCTITILPQVL